MLSDFKNEVLQIKGLITNSKHPLILVKENPSLDGLAAALVLYSCLKNGGKDANILCPSELTVEFSDLIKIDEIKKEISGKGLVISWEYNDGSIEKVSYNIENSRFNLVIHPREGMELKITPDKIDVKSTGLTSDLVICINTDNLSQLGNLFTLEQEMFSKIDIINVDNSLSNQNYGKINLVQPLVASVSELTGMLLMDLGVRPDQDAATNLLTAIDTTSLNLTSGKLLPETLEVAAWCLRSGGTRLSGKKLNVDSASAKAINEVLKTEKSLEKTDKDTTDNDTHEQKDETPSPDWLQPKIYRGSNLL